LAPAVLRFSVSFTMSFWIAFFLFLAALPIGFGIALVVVLHHFKRMRRGMPLSGEEQKRLAELWEEARELERRTVQLEILLDRADPDPVNPRWRSRYEEYEKL